jgi:hypothetical protein
LVRMGNMADWCDGDIKLGIIPEFTPYPEVSL